MIFAALYNAKILNLYKGWKNAVFQNARIR
ncbi:Transposase [Haemophilus influenzae]|uniref:Uncharacterized protein n=1 Tax=Haemophilus influenzae TaxID=727 RepID=A0A158SUP4_HAEIF|nr:hypothetical protein NTHI1209_00188 [Haemophilus influenzae]